MKTLIATLFFSVTFFSSAQFSKDEFQEIRRNLGTSIKSQFVKHDRFDDKIMVHSGTIKMYPFGTVKMYYGIFKKDGKIVRTSPRIQITYIGSNWVFIDEATIVYSRQKDGDENLNYSTDIFDDDSDTHVFSGGNVRESIDAIMSEDNIDFFEQIHKKKRGITVRVQGDKRKATLNCFGKEVISSTDLFFEKLYTYPHFSE